MHSNKFFPGLVICLLFGMVLIGNCLKAQFTAGNILVASSIDARVYEYDPAYNLISSWTHPNFGTQGQFGAFGPAGMVFDANGNLVVAARDSFCVFSASGVLLACHAKVASQATENVIFDFNGNLYTTTSTSGGNQIHKYDASYNFVNTFSMPTGQLTGITCDTVGNLFIASQSCQCVYKVDANSFSPVDVISGFAGRLEGLQIDHNGELLVAQHFPGNPVGEILRVNSSSPLLIQQTISVNGLRFPVPLTIDNAGNIYTSDWEDGVGSPLADIYTFSPSGSVTSSILPSIFHGPFGHCGRRDQLTLWRTTGTACPHPLQLGSHPTGIAPAMRWSNCALAQPKNRSPCSESLIQNSD